MRGVGRWAALGVAVAWLAAPGAASAGLLCGRSLVLPGASKREVLARCGAPTRRQGLDGKPLAGRATTKGGGREVWVYDLGSRQLVRYLTFEGGRLRGIDFGGYGR